MVYPALGRLLKPLVPTGQRYRWRGTGKTLNKAGGDEFWGLREYRDGDNPKHIHWRSSARLGKRLVKEFHHEQAEKVCVLLDAGLPTSAGELESRRFEEAVSFAATLSVYYLRQGYEVALAAGAVRVSADRGQRQFRRILGTLAEIVQDANPSFPELVNSLDYRFLRDSFVVAVLPDAERCPYATLAQLQEHRQSVRIIDVSAPAFHSIFQPPAVIVPEQSRRPQREDAT